MLVDEAAGDVKWEIGAHSNLSISRAVMSPGGRFVASVGSRDDHWILWDAASGAAHRMGSDGTGACICGDIHQSLEACPVVAHNTAGLLTLAFSPNGQRLATGGKDGSVILWDTQTGEAEQSLQGSSQKIWSLSFSASGEKVASTGFQGSIWVWNATTGELLRTIPEAHYGRSASWVHFSPRDERSLASVGGGQIQLWDAESGKLTKLMLGHFFVAFSPDGGSIATTGADVREVHLVDAEAGTERVRMVGHRCQVTSACFSPEGSKLASGSNDGTCKVWDSSTGALLRTIEVGRRVQSVGWGRDWVRDTS